MVLKLDKYRKIIRWVDEKFAENNFKKVKERMENLEGILFKECNYKISPNLTILDNGCGNAIYSVWFAKKGCTVYALDLMKDALKRAKTLLTDISKKIKTQKNG